MKQQALDQKRKKSHNISIDDTSDKDEYIDANRTPEKGDKSKDSDELDSDERDSPEFQNKYMIVNHSRK